jgi:hypothetical protein
MGRGIQPFGTLNDGDVLFAVTTCDIDNAELHPTDLGTVASELMWDAVLNSVPDIPNLTEDYCSDLLQVSEHGRIAARYQFGPNLELEVTGVGTYIRLYNSGSKDIFGITPGEFVLARAAGDKLFQTDSQFLSTVAFAGQASELQLILNPGPWEQVGVATP